MSRQLPQLGLTAKIGPKECNRRSGREANWARNLKVSLLHALAKGKGRKVLPAKIFFQNSEIMKNRFFQTGNFSPTRTKIDAARSILNLFSKIRILREAENTYCSFPARKHCWRHRKLVRICATVSELFFVQPRVPGSPSSSRLTTCGRPISADAALLGVHYLTSGPITTRDQVCSSQVARCCPGSTVQAAAPSGQGL